jgi:Uri superfamily endonuclease
MKGVYLLLIEFPEHKTLTIGKLGLIQFEEGYYAYVGSALNGLDQRIKRHLRKQKKIHWHIDYLLNSSTIISVFYTEKNKRQECDIAHMLEKNFPFIPGFGCSDCSCKSHLFYGSSEKITEVANYLQMKSYLLDANS